MPQMPAGPKNSRTLDRPWYVRTKGFEAPKDGEHPRLLFRRGDLPALRKKARTPEGKAILKRLRLLLDGKDGETMTTVFRPARGAPAGKNKVIDAPGIYTMGHAAGYGLLYQLTGDKKYAEFGRQCFEKALEGTPDRDIRYGFRAPGGPLRAGPSVGWYAVGYDLCYDGWDEAVRRKFGRAIEKYDEDSTNSRERIRSDLELLARGGRYLDRGFRRNIGTPPGSNHFGMQVGGVSLALLAISGEKWADQGRIDKLLATAEHSMIRNLTEGFGDGGFFAEGDGTGSMSSQIAYLSAILAWKNAAGKDFINAPRPNVRMLTLKWIYQTVFRDGKPDFWPVRGSYGGNTWARRGLSGAGYFAIGMGGVSRKHQAAMKWCYARFLAESDAAADQPFDTASVYPHLAVCAFVNWPTTIEAKNPAEVLPLCYRDSKWGFYVWRNRWKDENDTVISVLLKATRGFGGYLYSDPDRSLHLNTMGKHIRWGRSARGKAKYWWASPEGKSSSLTMSDGTCLAVDFTGASGADVMLVTTAKAAGQTVDVGGKKLTFYFPTTKEPPEVKVEGAAAVAGARRVTIADGNLVLTAGL
ncbi:MAG: hypothetical protein QGH60_17585 [Phycisphaerae bacterium]|nr:hypothetical protein [Phycisphaerae bacterium]